MADADADVPSIAEDGPDQPEAPTADQTVDDAAGVVNEATSEQADGDVDEVTVDLEEDDFGGDLFDSVDDVDDAGDSAQSSASSSSDGDSDGDAPLDGVDELEGANAEMEAALNEGAARMGVIGLTEEDFEDSNLSKDELREEFEQTFEAFRFGHFGSQMVEEYILKPADGEVSPVWGFVGAAMMAGAMMIWMRPDGDEKVEAAREAIGNIAGGVV